MDILKQLRMYPYEYTQKAADEITRLRTRLEIIPGTEIDGIDCRDETIRLQDAEIERLRDENAGLRKDAERLDWMSSCEAWIGWTRDNELCRAFRRDEDGDVYPVCGWDKFFDTARDAIDAAMEKGK